MTYLTSYRSTAVSKYGNDRVGAFKSPEPYRPQTRPLGDNDNAPRPANDNERPAPKPANDNSKLFNPKEPFGRRNVGLGIKATRALAGARFGAQGLRFVRINPYLNAALIALDLWNTFGRANGGYQTGDQVVDPAASGWLLDTMCSAVGQPPSHMRVNAVFGPWSSSLCLTGQGDNSNQNIYSDIAANIGQISFQKFTHFAVGNQPRFATSSYWHKNAADGRKFRSKIRTFREYEPYVVPWPDLLPIKWPMPYPLPLPMKLVNERLNDPIGSQRTNGDQRPGFIPRRPPPPGTREKKVRATTAAALGALQSVAHGVTEAIDMVDAVHSALPKSRQAKAQMVGGKWYNASPQAKLEAIYGNWDHVDMNKAVKNLIVNEVTDRLIGRSNARVNQGLNNSPIGRINRGVSF